MKPHDVLPGMKRPPAPRKISRATLVAYSWFLAAQLHYYRHRASVIEQKLKVLNERGILEGGFADDISLDDLMRCNITEA